MLYSDKDYGKNKIDYTTIEGISVPIIISESQEPSNIAKLQSLLIDGVFSKGGRGYISNENHLIFFNNVRAVTWINSHGYIHIVMTESKYGDHYRLHKTKNTFDCVKDGVYNSLTLINSSVNVIEKRNIYK